MTKTETKRKKFAKALVDNEGNRVDAYRKAYGDVSENTARCGAKRLLKEDGVKKNITLILEKRGLTRDHLVGKLKKVVDSDNEQTSLAGIKLGFELHGDIGNKVSAENLNLTQVNYNIENDKIEGVLRQLKGITDKLNMTEGYPDGEIINAETQYVNEDSED